MGENESYECIELEKQDDTAIVRICDERVTDPGRIEQLGKELATLTDEDQPDRLMLDFGRVRFFSSAAINKLIVMEKRARAAGKTMVLSNLRPEVRDLFQFTNLDRVFDIQDGRAEAGDE